MEDWLGGEELNGSFESILLSGVAGAQDNIGGVGGGQNKVCLESSEEEGRRKKELLFFPFLRIPLSGVGVDGGGRPLWL